LKKIFIIIFISAGTGILAFFSYFLAEMLFIYAKKPLNTDKREKIIVVYRGQSFEAAAERMYETGIIDNPFKLIWFARLKGYDKKVKAGEYGLSSAMSPAEILEIMVSGKIRICKLTVPEGYSMYQIADLIASEGFTTKADFLKAARDSAFAHGQGIDAETFEGYLFPDTYYFSKNIQSKQIISSMVKHFRSVFTPEWKNQTNALGFSVHEIVTLASIIEKETGETSERPLISSVFHNRLKKKMRLESDPTVIYGINNFDGNLKRIHLDTKTLYNTYKIKGLPPGPIANPGRESLEAAVFPLNTDFLFFVSKGNGTHEFTTNLKEHNTAVKKYQLKQLKR